MKEKADDLPLDSCGIFFLSQKLHGYYNYMNIDSISIFKNNQNPQ